MIKSYGYGVILIEAIEKENELQLNKPAKSRQFQWFYSLIHWNYGHFYWALMNFNRKMGKQFNSQLIT